MPPKNRDLIADLQRAGFIWLSTRGSHRKFFHPLTNETLTIPGQMGDDAKPYLVKLVRKAIQEVRDAEQR